MVKLNHLDKMIIGLIVLAFVVRLPYIAIPVAIAIYAVRRMSQMQSSKCEENRKSTTEEEILNQLKILNERVQNLEKGSKS